MKKGAELSAPFLSLLDHNLTTVLANVEMANG